MSKYELLAKQYKEDRAKQIKEATEYITLGYISTWNQDAKKESDNGIRRYSTETRWNQYQKGEITRDKAIEYAVKRMTKEADKKTAAGLEKIERIENTPELTFASGTVSYSRYYNASAEVFTNGGRFNGHAGGYGYDKTSAAVAEAFNQDDIMLKVLFDLKEKGLKEGLTSESKTACTGHDNRNIIGYGSGYSVLPYYEGGVGIECFFSILKKAGYKTTTFNGKHDFIFRIEKESDN